MLNYYYYGYSGAKAFPNATFGPASYALPVHFDGLECIGGETQLTHCWHDKDAKCLHSEDASVDCLGRDIGINYSCCKSTLLAI